MVLFADECHLLQGDAPGYARERQTCYGAVSLLNGSAFVMQAEAGNGTGSVKFLKTLRRNFQGRRLLIFRDRATCHRGSLIKDYLRELNGERHEAGRLIHPEYFAPNAPGQNPTEDVWLAAKRRIRTHLFELKTFRQVKHRFVTFINNFTLNTVRFNWYREPQMI